MNPADILAALREFTALESVDFLPLAPDPAPVSTYPPIAKYVADLKNKTKPETAAEELFASLCGDLLSITLTRQVGLSEGYVDFVLKERAGDPLPLELKPLFQRDGEDALRRKDANPDHHVAQVKKYLRDNEYLILTDLRTTWLFAARDFSFENKPFATLPFADFLDRCRSSRSIMDTLRRVEDSAEKPELEQQFFADLKVWFNEFEKVRWNPPELAAESIILLINKLIFARTIEDYGLVQYRFTQDEYARYTKLWEPKGAHRVVPKFLEFFEDFFDEYYDTEIFSNRVWDRLDQDPANLQRFCEKLNFVLGVHTWDQAFSRGIVHYNYRRIDEDIFGKSYEMFLAANRKDEGIYYTPAGITGPMADALVNSLAGDIVDDLCAAVGSQQCDFARAEKRMAQLAEIRVADTACGSGGFLIKVLRAFWRQYQRVEAASRWVVELTRSRDGELYLAELPPNVAAAQAFRERHQFDNARVLIARILLRHVFGLDKDAGAIEVAKTNIWKEAVKLSPDDYNYRLLKLDIVKILPNLQLNFHCADSLVDIPVEKQVAWLAEYHQAELKKLAELRAEYIENPMRHEALDEALALRGKLRTNLLEQFAAENLPCEPGGLALQFWPGWFKADGTARPFTVPATALASLETPEKSTGKKGRKAAASSTPAPVPTETAAGFDGIIGNPPWEGFKPIRKEFAAGYYRGKPQFSKLGMDGPAFESWFAKELKENEDFATRWREHEAYYERHKAYFSRTFHRQGTGDWNLFKLFIERDLTLVRSGGQFSLLVPSSIQTDEGCADLRRWFITEHRLDELTSFENRGYKVVENGREVSKQIFPDVDGRFKFSFFKVVKDAVTPEGHSFDARFYLRDPKDAFNEPIRYNLEVAATFSPKNLAFMEFRSARDYDLGLKIRAKHALLGSLGYQFRRELHLTGDARFLNKIGSKKLVAGELPLLEGKSISQYDAKYTPPSWFVKEPEVRAELLRKEVFRIGDFVRDSETTTFEGNPLPKSRDELEDIIQAVFEKRKFKLHYEFERLAYREVGRSTDERTLIASILPPQACFSHKLMYLTPCRYRLGAKGKLEQDEVPLLDAKALLALMNSLTLNFYVRCKVSTGVSLHHLYELPVPELATEQKQKLADFAGMLLADPRNVTERAALEAYIARDLYGLTRADWQHLTASFTFGSGETKAELDEIIRQSLALWPA